MSVNGIPGTGELGHYQRDLQATLANTETELRTWQKFDKDYATLSDFLIETIKSVRKQIMVPIGDLAFMPGEIVHTNEVTVLLGDNWFVECSADHAVGIVERRRDYTKQKIDELEKQLSDLQVRQKLISNDFFLDKQEVDADGDQVNEEGLKFVDIVEEYNEEEETAKAATASKQPPQAPPKRVEKKADLEDWQRKMLDRLAQLEAEEEENAGNEEENESEEEEEEDADDAAAEVDSEDEMRFQEVDDDEDDYNAPIEYLPKKKSNLKSKSKKPKMTAKHVSFSSDSQDGAARNLTGSSQRPGPADPHRPTQLVRNADNGKRGASAIKDLVEEKEVKEFEDESDVEDYLFGKELAEEYYKKRHQYLVTQGRQDRPEEEEEEEREALKEQKISRFRAARMAVRDAVEFPDQVVRNAVEFPSEIKSAPQPPQQRPQSEPSRFQPRAPAQRRQVPSSGASGSQQPSLPTPAPAPKQSVDPAPPKKISRFMAARKGIVEDPPAPPPAADDEDDTEVSASRPRLGAPPVVAKGKKPSR
ncbi:uri1, prefoldin-like chaperone [Rhizophlyctis rosea]|uniref:Uri1, prefoldin-like chaperone n=1 Tax=Rhizophlyctis rosea TaxID=64517 RepID=A0AAD5X197_9FUNG|nr:uri1, prefoldin-like chaperone [Rhizophlyctis rosea]